MENDQNQPGNVPKMQEAAPVVPESELKMPEQEFTGQAPVPDAPKSRTLLYVLVAIFVLLLAVLGALLLYGEELMELIIPQEPTVQPLPAEPMPEETAATTTIEDLAAMEAALEGTDLSEFDAELEAIDAELEAELE